MNIKRYFWIPRVLDVYTDLYIWTGAISRHLVFFTGTYCTCMLTKLYIESFEINYQVIKILVFNHLDETLKLFLSKTGNRFQVSYYPCLIEYPYYIRLNPLIICF